jgi:predicted anti-sigma-YlaC factor YlaD
MDCDSIRIAVSAALDGEDAGVPEDRVRAHLDGCGACRAWRERQHALTRRVRLGGPALDRDLAPRVLAAIPGPPASGGVWRVAGPGWKRGALVVVAVAQLAITVPLLMLGHDHAAGAHAAHELGSFDLALAIAFAVGAAAPRLSAGLAWPCCIAALGLAGTAVADIIAGQTPGADEAQHLVAVAGGVLLFWQARTSFHRTPRAISITRARFAPGAGEPGGFRDSDPPASVPWAPVAMGEEPAARRVEPAVWREEPAARREEPAVWREIPAARREAGAARREDAA